MSEDIGIGKGIFWGALVVIMLGLLGAAIWAIGVGTSDVAGKGNVIRQRNSADNRILAQERFEQRYADIKAADAKVGVAFEAYDSDRSDATAKTNYFGARNYCLSLIADYDAAARKITQERFRAADLPYQIDQSDPTTDCLAAAS